MGNLRVDQTFEAMFAPGDVRETFRQSLPTGLGEDEEQALKRKLAEARVHPDEIESPGTQMYQGRNNSLDEGYILPTRSDGGRVKPEARKAGKIRRRAYDFQCFYCADLIGLRDTKEMEA